MTHETGNRQLIQVCSIVSVDEMSTNSVDWYQQKYFLNSLFAFSSLAPGTQSHWNRIFTRMKSIHRMTFLNPTKRLLSNCISMKESIQRVVRLRVFIVDKNRRANFEIVLPRIAATMAKIWRIRKRSMNRPCELCEALKLLFRLFRVAHFRLTAPQRSTNCFPRTVLHALRHWLCAVRRMRLVPAHLCLCVNARAETVSCRPTVAWWITCAMLFYAIWLIHSPRQPEIFGVGISPMENSFCAKRNFMDSYGYWIYMWNVTIRMHACIWYFFVFCHAREFMPRNEFTWTIKKHCHQNRKKRQKPKHFGSSDNNFCILFLQSHF